MYKRTWKASLMLCIRSLSLSLLSSLRTFLSLPLDLRFLRLPDLIVPLPFRPCPSDPVHVSSLICHRSIPLNILYSVNTKHRNTFDVRCKKNLTHRRRVGKFEFPLTRRSWGLATRHSCRHYAAPKVWFLYVVSWIWTHFCRENILLTHFITIFQTC